MNVTTTGRPRNDASETAAPFWSTSEIAGARSFPAAHVPAGPSETGATVSPLLACVEVPTSRSAIPAATPMSSTALQKKTRGVSTLRGAGTDGGVTDTHHRG